MLKATIKNRDTGERVATLDIPSSPSETKYIKFAYLEACANRINRYIAKCFKEQEEGKTEEVKISKLKYAKMIRETIQHYFDLDEKTSKHIVAGDIDAHLENFGQWRNPDMKQIDSFQLYEYLYTVIFKYKPKEVNEERKFRIGNEEFYIPNFVVDEVLKSRRNPRLNVQENIECLIIQDEIRKQIENIGDDEEKVELGGDDLSGWQAKAKLNFFRTIKKISIFCRKKGEELPTDETEFKNWLAERTKIIYNINMEDALDALFFFNSTTLRYETTKSINTILRHRNQEREAEKAVSNFQSV